MLGELIEVTFGHVRGLEGEAGPGEDGVDGEGVADGGEERGAEGGREGIGVGEARREVEAPVEADAHEVRRQPAHIAQSRLRSGAG